MLKWKIACTLLSITYQVMAQTPLFIPDTISGKQITLNVKDSTAIWYTGLNTATIGFNGAYLGPTILLNKGDSVYFNVSNQLADTTTVHWHGLHVSPQNDGGPHTKIPPATTWSPSFEVMDLAGTYWYHSHLHHKTVEQVTKGEAGMIIIRDTAEAKLTLPRTYGVDDFPLVLQSRGFDASGQFLIMTHSDSVILINGTKDPVLQVPAQVVRFRCVNGSTNRMYNIGVQGNLSFAQISSDGGLLNQSLNLTRLRLAPGERAELLIDLSGKSGQTIQLMSFGSELPNGIYGAANPSAMGPGTITGYSGNPLNGNDFSLLTLSVTPSTSNPVTTIPNLLVPVIPISPAASNGTFTVTFSPAQMGPNTMLNGPFVLNNQSFNMGIINYTTTLGRTETWVLQNNTAIAHPFHVHGLQFYVIDRNGAAPPASEQGRKDVIMVHAQETVRIIMAFEDFTDPVVPYMYHCHMLMHEEEGMMGQYLVILPTSVIDLQNLEQSIIYPNPITDHFYIPESLVGQKLFLSDLSGRVLMQFTAQDNGPISGAHLERGMYLLYSQNSSTSYKIVKE